MKLALNNNIRYSSIAQKSVFKEHCLNKDSDVHFGGSFQKIVKKGGEGVLYTNIAEITQKIDGILGDNFLKSRFEKIGIDVNSTDQYLVKDSSIIKDIYKTVKYPFVDLPLDFANFVLKILKKIPFLSDFANNAQKLKLLAKRANTVEIEKSREAISNILEAFADKDSVLLNKNSEVIFDINRCKESFIKKAAGNLSKTVKNYNSRDERTLNRLITSFVSAIYGSRDFYNISMLQKNDKKEAKKAKKSRFKQEMTRTGLSAGMTFLTLGALDKYTKNSLMWTVATIVGSSLIAEIVSRLINKVSLVPLTSKKAEKIAKAKKAKLNMQNQKNDTATVSKHDNIPFKNTFKIDSKIYEKFAGKDSFLPYFNLTTNSCNKEQETVNKNNNSHKKRIGAKGIIALAFGSASLIYLINYFLKTSGVKNKLISDFVNNNYDKLKSYVSGEETFIDDDFISKVLYIKENNAKAHPISITKERIADIYKKIKGYVCLIKKKKVTYSKQEIIGKIDKIENTKEGAEIKALLDECKKFINKNPDKIEALEDRKFISGLISGVGKIFNTAWLVLSFPGVLIKGVINKISNKKDIDLFNKVLKKIDNRTKDIHVDVTSLNKVLNRYENPVECAEVLKRNMRAFGSGSETGNIANYSRAFVTMISSYFFVNDYYNKVLIESEGKNITEAQEERNERIAHKLSNFVVNGTLMNIFNSVFVKALNNSLIQATLIAGATEMTNEFLVRKSICQPIKKMNSRDEIIEWEKKQTSRKGLIGAWSRFFKKITGKKTLTEKACIDVSKEKESNEQKAKNV